MVHQKLLADLVLLLNKSVSDALEEIYKKGNSHTETQIQVALNSCNKALSNMADFLLDKKQLENDNLCELVFSRNTLQRMSLDRVENNDIHLRITRSRKLAESLELLYLDYYHFDDLFFSLITTMIELFFCLESLI